MYKSLAARFALGTAFAFSILSFGTSAQAVPITQITTWGTLDPACTFEQASCASDPAFDPSLGGYRAGGSVSWGDPLNPSNPFVFDTSAFSSISSIVIEIIVVGFLDAYQGNIDPSGGQQIGNYFAIDGTPFAPFLDMTDHRDTRSFDLTGVLLAGDHTFSVVAYINPPGPNYEGWAGVDIATLTVTGESVEAVPLPAALPLFAAGLSAMGFMSWRRKRKTA